MRDFVLGAQLLDGRGELLPSAASVMKNVAGYDVARLLAGSLGTLGVIVEVSLKVLPRPATERTLRVRCRRSDRHRADERMGRTAAADLGQRLGRR